MSELLISFLKRAFVENKTGTIVITGLATVALFCITGHLSFANPAISLPQPSLGYSLLGLVAVLIGLSFATHFLTIRASSITTRDKLRRQYSDDIIKENIKIQISGEGEGLTFWKFEGDGEIRAWLYVVNFNPFPIQIDRIVGSANVSNSHVAEVSDLNRPQIEAGNAKQIYIKSRLQLEDIKRIAFQLSQAGEISGTGLQLTIWVDTMLGRVELRRQLTTTAYRFPNFQRPKVS